MVFFVACSADLPSEESEHATSQVQLSSRSRSKLLPSARPVRDQYIVVLEDGTGSVPAVAAEQASRAGATVGHVFQHALRGYVLRGPEAAVQRLLDDPRVKYVEEDGVVHLSGTQLDPTWGLDRIDQRFLPLDSTYTSNATGAGVNAYIIDTGIRITHAEFGGRASHAFDSIGDGNGANDCHGHGTHVAGTVGGATYGVAKQVNLFAVRVLSCSGSGTWSGVIAGIDWVTANRVLPAVANMSLGGGASQATDDAVTNSVNSGGVTYVLAAGNSSTDACGYSPARTPVAITVGATTSLDARASYSNYGPCLDLFAPGSSVTSAWHASDTAINTISGTSMASPHVAGAAALYLSVNGAATPAEVTAALTANATPDQVTGASAGSPNLLLYSRFIGGGGGDTTPPAASLTAPAGGETVVGSVQMTADASDDVGVALVSFYIDGVLKGSDGTEPYQHTWDSTSGGNRTHTLGVRAFDAAGNASAISTVTVNVNNPGQAGYDAVLKAPACSTVGPQCDSGALINGRGPLGPESNAPNTISSSCADGTHGSYHVDESLDRLRIQTLDGSDLAPGKTVRIDATVWAWENGVSDRLDLYYAADATNPVWTYLTTLAPPGGGARTLSATYTLPVGSLQAIRGNFRYSGSPATCTPGTYDDRDDLVFAVGEPPPGPAVSFSRSCTGLTCSFTDTSTDSTGTINAWSWSFGDGAGSSAQSPTHTFAAPGTYTVSLTATDDQGLSGTASSPVTVAARPPVASFTVSCAALTCSFTDTSTDPDGAVVAWSWIFTNGYSSPAQNPSFVFAPGTYTVSLTVTNSFGLTHTASQSFTVTVPPPVASFTASCTTLSCSFTDTSTDATSGVVAWSWSFGDGSGSTARFPSHVYAAHGTYTMTLTVTNGYGLTDTTTRTITVTAPVITLGATGARIKGQRWVDLSWSGALSESMDLYRNGALIGSTTNDGAERTGVDRSGTYQYQVCQMGTSYCSNVATVTF